MKKHIFIADALIILISLGVIVGFIGYMNSDKVQLSPEEASRSDVLFWFENSGEQILIDNNPEFFSARAYDVHDGATILLEEGIYYLRIEHADYYEIKTLTVQTPIVLKLVKLQEGVFGVMQVTDRSLFVVAQSADGDESFLFESSGGKQ